MSDDSKLFQAHVGEGNCDGWFIPTEDQAYSWETDGQCFTFLGLDGEIERVLVAGDFGRKSLRWCYIENCVTARYLDR